MSSKRRFVFYISDRYVEFSISIPEQASEEARKFLLRLLGREDASKGNDFYFVTSNQYAQFESFLAARK